MKKNDIRLRGKVHRADVYIGGTYQSLTIRLRKQVVKALVYIMELPNRVGVSVRNRMLVSNSPLATFLRKFISVEDSIVVVDPRVGDGVIRTVFDGGINLVQVNQEVGDISSSKVIRDIESTVEITSENIGAIRELYSSVDSLMDIVSSMDMKTAASMFAAIDNAISLDSHAGVWGLDKYVSVEDITKLSSAVNAAIERFSGTGEVVMIFDSSVMAAMTVYRRLSEIYTDGIRDLYLSDFGDMRLGEIYYIEK